MGEIDPKSGPVGQPDEAKPGLDAEQLKLEVERDKLKAQIYTDEIKDAFEDLKDQKSHLVNIVRIYLVVLGGLLIYTSFTNGVVKDFRESKSKETATTVLQCPMTQHSSSTAFHETDSSSIPKPLNLPDSSSGTVGTKESGGDDRNNSNKYEPVWAVSMMGIGFSIIAFLSGWVIIVYTGHSVRRQFLARRHIAKLRGELLRLVPNALDPMGEGWLPSSAARENLSQKDKYSNMVFAAANLMVLVFSGWFLYLSDIGNLKWSVASYAYSMIIWWYTPSVALYFAEIEVALYARTTTLLLVLEKAKNDMESHYHRKWALFRISIPFIALAVVLVASWLMYQEQTHLYESNIIEGWWWYPHSYYIVGACALMLAFRLIYFSKRHISIKKRIHEIINSPQYKTEETLPDAKTGNPTADN